MKCIRILETKEVRRVYDHAAKLEVEAKKAEYVPRSVWKAEVRDKDKAKPQVPANPKERNEQAAAELKQHVRSKDKREANRKGRAA